MEQNYTQLDLIKFIYKETSAAETIAISEALSKDPLLWNEYQELFEGYKLLPKAKFSPKPTTANAILGYSKQTALNPMH